MATYDNLPICHASYTLLLELFRFTREFIREYKYTLLLELFRFTREFTREYILILKSPQNFPFSTQNLGLVVRSS